MDAADEAEARATGMVLKAELDVTRDGVERWRDEQLACSPRVNGTVLTKH